MENGVSPNGFWTDDRGDGHYFDRSLARALAELMDEKGIMTVMDLGCGKGEYSRFLGERGFACTCVDGNPNTESMTDGLCLTGDLCEKMDMGEHHCVLSLEVGEHMPERCEETYVENIMRHAGRIIIISWAVPGQKGRGHVNEKENKYVEGLLLGEFARMEREEDLLRGRSSLEWFRNTVMVYERTRGKA